MLPHSIYEIYVFFVLRFIACYIKYSVFFSIQTQHDIFLRSDLVKKVEKCFQDTLAIRLFIDLVFSLRYLGFAQF